MKCPFPNATLLHVYRSDRSIPPFHHRRNNVVGMFLKYIIYLPRSLINASVVLTPKCLNNPPLVSSQTHAFKRNTKPKTDAIVTRQGQMPQQGESFYNTNSIRRSGAHPTETSTVLFRRSNPGASHARLLNRQGYPLPMLPRIYPVSLLLFTSEYPVFALSNTPFVFCRASLDIGLVRVRLCLVPDWLWPFL